MKYLFFDCEFANCFDSKEKICEFGYVMADENFNVLYKDNIGDRYNLQFSILNSVMSVAHF